MRATRGVLRARLVCCAARQAPALPPCALPCAPPRACSHPARLSTRLRGAAAEGAACDVDEADDIAADLFVASTSASAAPALRDCRLVLGVDPDVHGALSVLRWGPQPAPAGGSGASAAQRAHAGADADAPALHTEVFDTPSMQARPRAACARKRGVGGADGSVARFFALSLPLVR